MRGAPVLLREAHIAVAVLHERSARAPAAAWRRRPLPNDGTVAALPATAVAHARPLGRGAIARSRGAA